MSHLNFYPNLISLLFLEGKCFSFKLESFEQKNNVKLHMDENMYRFKFGIISQCTWATSSALPACLSVLRHCVCEILLIAKWFINFGTKTFSSLKKYSLKNLRGKNQNAEFPKFAFEFLTFSECDFPIFLWKTFMKFKTKNYFSQKIHEI